MLQTIDHRRATIFEQMQIMDYGPWEKPKAPYLRGIQWHKIMVRFFGKLLSTKITMSTKF